MITDVINRFGNVLNFCIGFRKLCVSVQSAEKCLACY